MQLLPGPDTLAFDLRAFTDPRLGAGLQRPQVRALCGVAFRLGHASATWKVRHTSLGPECGSGFFQRAPGSGAAGLRHAVPGTQTVTPSGNVKDVTRQFL